MADLQQRVFMIFVRPCFVRRSATPGYPASATKYFGKLYRDAVGTETVYEVKQYQQKVSSGTPPSPQTGNLPAGYKVAIELPELNAMKPVNPADPIGGGIERYYDDTKGRMPDPGKVSKNSTPPFNENNWFSNDPWMLHSTWTSFEECKNYVRLLIDLLGFDGVLVSNFIPLDLELLPNK